MLFSPEFRDKVRKFKKNRPAYNSLRILTFLFLLTLPAELLFNNKPIVMRVDGNWFFPVFRAYTYQDLGGEHAIPIVGYRSKMFAAFVAGNTSDVLLSGAPSETGKCTPRKFWALWPPVPHSYKSFCGRSRKDRRVIHSLAISRACVSTRAAAPNSSGRTG